MFLRLTRGLYIDFMLQKVPLRIVLVIHLFILPIYYYLCDY